MTYSAEVMATHFGSKEHPCFPLQDWIAAVTNKLTRHGYWEWIAAELSHQALNNVDTDIHVSHSIPPEKRQAYYDNKLIATVSFENGVLKVEGGKTEKDQLKRAKMETEFCFVKDAKTKKDVRLKLENGKWCRA